MAAIREAQPSEARAVSDLVLEAYAEYERDFPAERWEMILKSYSNPDGWGGRLLVAAEDSELLGSIVYFRPGEAPAMYFRPEWAALRLLAVPSKHRGKGLGRLLTEECIRRARADGAPLIGLHTTEAMAIARSMYERMGFTVDHQVPDRTPRTWVYTLQL